MNKHEKSWEKRVFRLSEKPFGPLSDHVFASGALWLHMLSLHDRLRVAKVALRRAHGAFLPLSALEKASKSLETPCVWSVLKPSKPRLDRSRLSEGDFQVEALRAIQSAWVPRRWAATRGSRSALRSSPPARPAAWRATSEKLNIASGRVQKGRHFPSRFQLFRWFFTLLNHL